MKTDYEAGSMFAIYERPLDYPDDFVVRRFGVVEGKPGREGACRYRQYSGGRALLDSRRFVPIPRSDGDDPVIVESWL